ncbi:MAG: hypothetical protein HKN74_04600 [Acidimicrobiia bacterium]|nr:hypothetical protein [Acidimicrobiia bacterium]MBT8217723.1 hypothetical protein [Acidimicrobiia bacterium]NNF09544.1 hypothetical protein [Acidimicrobiia bacterium]NNL71482.1 hypothetical protein [Acidimicrobiia bacterium]
MGRLERRLLAIGDELERIHEEERLISDELSYHRSLADDAARDAAVFGDPIERENASVTASDVRRFERQLAKVVDRRQKLEARRARLLDKLESR